MTRRLRYTPVSVLSHEGDPLPPPSHHALVTIDPGGHTSSLAVWAVPRAPADRPRLVGAAKVSTRRVVPYATTAAHDAIHAAPTAWVVERPHVRGVQHHTRSGVEALEEALGVIRAARPRPSTWRAVRPAGWKGALPKRVHHVRILEVAVEHGAPRAVVDPDSPHYDHDIADAIALGLWALGIVERGGKSWE